MKRGFILSVMLAVLASPAVALSCLRPDVVRSYHQAAGAEEHYVVVHGELRFDQSRLPDAELNDSPPSTRIAAKLSGHALSNGTFSHPFDRSIKLDVLCFGPWCGVAKSGVDYLAFLEVREGGYILKINPCGGQAFAEPTPEMLRQVEQCNAGGPCKTQTR